LPGPRVGGIKAELALANFLVGLIDVLAAGQSPFSATPWFVAAVLVGAVAGLKLLASALLTGI